MALDVAFNRLQRGGLAAKPVAALTRNGMRSPSANSDQRTAYGVRVILDKIQRSALASPEAAERIPNRQEKGVEKQRLS
jgi:hypothetical protein